MPAQDRYIETSVLVIFQDVVVDILLVHFSSLSQMNAGYVAQILRVCFLLASIISAGACQGR